MATGIIQDKLPEDPDLPTPAPPLAVDSADAPAEQAPVGETAPIREPFQAPTTTPVTTEVQPLDTVAGQMNKLSESGNKFVELNRADAVRQANSRGLVNSVGAGTAGVEAAIRSSLPIAQQDAATYNQTRLANQDVQNRFLENRQSTDLNKEMADFDSLLSEGRMRLENDLKTQFELTMNDERMSDEVKLQYINTINNIMRDAQAQIVQVGISDRSAKAQAAAIDRIEKNRNAAIKVYQDLLGGFDDWDWGTDFTPEAVKIPKSKSDKSESETPGGLINPSPDRFPWNRDGR